MRTSVFLAGLFIARALDRLAFVGNVKFVFLMGLLFLIMDFMELYLKTREQLFIKHNITDPTCPSCKKSINSSCKDWWHIVN